jgi:hypothetical protein
LPNSVKERQLKCRNADQLISSANGMCWTLSKYEWLLRWTIQFNHTYRRQELFSRFEREILVFPWFFWFLVFRNYGTTQGRMH